MCSEQALWTGKPSLKKTFLKFIVSFIMITILLILGPVIFPPLLLPSALFFFLLLLLALVARLLSPSFQELIGELLLISMITIFLMGATIVFFSLVIFSWLVFSILFFILYCLNKKAFTYYIRKESVKIEKSGILSSYVKVISFDEIKEVHIQQGFLAKRLSCGSLVFTLTGIGTPYSEPIIVREDTRIIFLRSMLSMLLKGRSIFWDIQNPEKVANILINEIAKRRKALEQKMTLDSIFRELNRLKKLLDEGVITQWEYEEAKRKLIVLIPQQTVTCKYCGTVYPESEVKCPNCGAPRRP